MKTRWIKLAAAAVILMALPAFGSGIYPPPTTWDPASLASYSQPLIASGTSLPATASGSAGNLFLLLGDTPAWWRHDGSDWIAVSGGSGDGGGVAVVNEDPDPDTVSVSTLYCVLSATETSAIPILTLAIASIPAVLGDYVATLTATMTSNTTPTGIASSGGLGTQPVESAAAYYAFDRSAVNQCSLSISGGNAKTWLEYIFDDAKVVDTVKVQGSYWTVGSWTFEASNDGSSWAVLGSGTATGLTGASPVWVDFSITNSLPYTRYRICQIGPGVYHMQVTEAQLSGYVLEADASPSMLLPIGIVDGLASEDIELPYQWGVSSWTLHIRRGAIVGVDTP